MNIAEDHDAHNAPKMQFFDEDRSGLCIMFCNQNRKSLKQGNILNETFRVISVTHDEDQSIIDAEHIHHKHKRKFIAEDVVIDHD